MLVAICRSWLWAGASLRSGLNQLPGPSSAATTDVCMERDRSCSRAVRPLPAPSVVFCMRVQALLRPGSGRLNVYALGSGGGASMVGRRATRWEGGGNAGALVSRSCSSAHPLSGETGRGPSCCTGLGEEQDFPDTRSKEKSEENKLELTHWAQLGSRFTLHIESSAHLRPRSPTRVCPRHRPLGKTGSGHLCGAGGNGAGLVGRGPAK